MPRFHAPLLTGLIVLAASFPALAADPPAGTWRATFPVQTQRGEVNLSLLFMFSESEGKWVGDFLDSSPPLGAEPAVELTVKDDSVKFSIKFGPNNWSFDGKVSGKRVKGSLDLGGDMVLVDLVPSSLKSLTKDKFAASRENLDMAENPVDFFNNLFPVIAQAAAKKLKVEDVRAYADKAAKMAEAYGSRWQRTVAFRLADVLADQEPFAAIAVEQARQGERLMTRTDDIATQLQTLDTLARVLRKAKKDADAKEVEGRVAKLEPRDYAEYAKTMPPFKPDEFKGRKGKSDRAVLVELFTGVECSPCVSVDLAFDSLGRTYKPADVILLQYHAHIPGPDPLVSKDGSARMDFYDKKDDDKSTPQLFINGKMDGSGGGAAPKMAKLKYQAYRETIDELLEKPATVKLTATAALKGDELTIKANVADLAKPGDKVALRFALAEERVRFQGGNGIRYHHSVVRAMPGGPKGFPLTKAAAEQSVTVKLDEVRTTNIKFLDDFAADLKKQGADFSFSNRPMALKNLRVVAFVQNDETNEVLQAVQVDVDAGKE
ncbi:MAG TPA: hypothetical protein VHR66_01305 [Gemmataceae bacterium]|jgi:hypothetical protein|nr:hypothetical protein [Gemmataceae bacterium]